ncbi:chlorophyll synthase [Haloactinopolyspora alba]|uniref:Chlorophyll synthase n=1 Tax=Haloactinopolyspora alba TaxID=648780 RepID=A0A2P8E1A9_9ACTN|nr:UbiA family prenyltransferase [Haloactinopolyspora alba]PSL03251.1 chlorophyll synthase [Haloactinopolyspora alba]
MTSTVSRPAPARFVRDVVALGRPWFWPVSLVPYYVGVVLATRRLLPPVSALPEVAAGGLVIGPLMWWAVLAVNDAHDVAGDRLNPRKAGTPLASGRMTPSAAQRVAGVAAALAVAVAWNVGLAFALGTVTALLVGWAYSAPPLRLKVRPGADIAVNAIALGAFGLLAGWVTVRPVGAFPWVMAVLGTLVAVALYVPTTVADLDADRAGGYTTVAVRLGLARVRMLGFTAWTAAAVLAVVLAATGTVIPRRMLALEVVMVPLLVAAYRRLVTTEPSFRNVVVLAVAFLAPCITFALTYTGVW